MNHEEVLKNGEISVPIHKSEGIKWVWMKIGPIEDTVYLKSGFSEFV